MQDDVLIHHGVKGMKWGHWNEETKRRYSGSGSLMKKHGDSISEALKGAGTRVALEIPEIAKSLFLTGTIANPTAIAVGVGSAAILGFAVSEVKKTKTYAKGKARIQSLLAGN